jgi:hypothetical protein
MKKNKKPFISEKDLQKEVIVTLKHYPSIYWIRNNSYAGKVIGRNGKVGWLNNAKKGAPDIILCKNGCWLGLELKSSDGRQSPEQKKAEEDIRQAGGHYFLIRTIQELDDIIEYY